MWGGGDFCGLHFLGCNDHWLLDWFVQKEASADVGGQNEVRIQLIPHSLFLLEQHLWQQLRLFCCCSFANDGSFFWVIVNLELCTKISSPHSFSQDSLLLICVLPHHPLFDFHHFCNPFPVLTFVCTEHFEQFLILCLDLQMDRYELSKYLVNKYT